MPELLENTAVIKLRACEFVQETAERFSIVRRAGSSRVVVQQRGLEACRLLQAGSAIQAVKARLAGRHGVAEHAVDLGPLLRSLQRADLIASVDGRKIPEARRPNLRSAFRYVLRFHLKKTLLQLAYGKLPTPIGRTLAYWTHRVDLFAAMHAKAHHAAQHVERCSADSIPSSSRRGFAGRYANHLVQNVVDFECIHRMTPIRAEKWLDRHTRYEGLEHLEKAKREGLPVIIAGFHFSATKLLALLLLRRGYDLNQIWMPDGSIDLPTIEKTLQEQQRQLPAYGKLNIIPDFTLPSFRRLMKGLRDGGTLVWFADMFGGGKEPAAGELPSKEWRDSASKIFDFAVLKTEQTQARIEVMLCGQRVYLNPWIGGFARTSGAVVIPAALIRNRNGFCMTLSPELRLPPNATAGQIDELNRALFGRLDCWLQRHPDQWFGWHSLCPVEAASI